MKTVFTRICIIAALLLSLPACLYILSILLLFCNVGFLYDLLHGTLKEFDLTRLVLHNMDRIMVYAPGLAFLLMGAVIIRIKTIGVVAGTDGVRSSARGRGIYWMLAFSGLVLLTACFLFK